MSVVYSSPKHVDKTLYLRRLRPPQMELIMTPLGGVYWKVLDAAMRDEWYIPPPEPDSHYETHHRNQATKRVPPQKAFEAGDSGDEYGTAAKQDNPKVAAIRALLDEFGRYHPKDGSKPLAKPSHIWMMLVRDKVKFPFQLTPELIEQAQPHGYSKRLEIRKGAR